MRKVIASIIIILCLIGTFFFLKHERLAKFKSLDRNGQGDFILELADKDPKAAWDYVLSAYKSSDGVSEDAHDLAHIVGEALFRKYGLQGASICTPDFAFGCYHGLMETAFEGESLDNYKADLVKAGGICEAMPGGAAASCVHGIGHGVVSYREYDLDKSLADCDGFGKYSSNCYDGVFMELSDSALDTFYHKDDPLYPCDAIGEPYRGACARSQAVVMMSKFKLDQSHISGICLKSGDSNIEYNCIDALGYYAADYSGNNAKNAISYCAGIEDKDANAQCLAAAAGEFVFQNMSGWQSSSKEICDSLSEGFQKECFGRVDTVKASYGRS